MATLVQAIDGGVQSDPQTLTLNTEPVEGNLLIALGSNRTGVSATNDVLTGITGWTKRLERDTLLGNANARRSFSVWSKIAGASEGTSVTLDNGTADGKHLSVFEFALGTGEDQWVFEESASNDNGTTTGATSIATGTTPSVDGTKFLEIALLIPRNASGGWTTGSEAFTGGITRQYGGVTNANQMCHVMGADFADTTAEAKSSTISSIDTDNTGLSAGIVVFSLEAPALGHNVQFGPLLGVS